MTALPPASSFNTGLVIESPLIVELSVIVMETVVTAAEATKTEPVRLVRVAVSVMVCAAAFQKLSELLLAARTASVKYKPTFVAAEVKENMLLDAVVTADVEAMETINCEAAPCTRRKPCAAVIVLERIDIPLEAPTRLPRIRNRPDPVDVTADDTVSAIPVTAPARLNDSAVLLSVMLLEMEITGFVLAPAMYKWPKPTPRQVQREVPMMRRERLVVAPAKKRFALDSAEVPLVSNDPPLTVTPTLETVIAADEANRL